MEKSVKAREGILVSNSNSLEQLQHRKLKLNILAFCTVLIWATAFPLTKVVENDFTPDALGLIRCVVASITLLALGFFSHIKKPVSMKAVLWLLLSGLLGFGLYIIIFTTGIKTLTSATSSLIMASTPIMTAIVASKIYHDKIRPAGWMCIFMAFVGVVVLLLWDGVLSINVGVLWTLGAAVSFCFYNMINRHLSSMGHTAIEIVTYSMMAGALMLMLFLPKTVGQIADADGMALAVAVYLGLGPSAAAYLLWAKASEYAERTNEVTNYMFITPLLATVLGFMILGEIPGIETLIGGVIIIASVILFNKVGK